MSQRHARGFTVVELMFSMTFISIMLITIANVTIFVNRLFTRGITYQAVNETGREVSGQLRRDIAGQTIARTGEAIKVTLNGTIDGGKSNGRERLCLGNYSYVWNTPQALVSPHQHDKEVFRGKVVHLLRVRDPDGVLCRTDNKGHLPELSSVAGSDAEDLLGGQGNNRVTSSSTAMQSRLAVYSVRVTKGPEDELSRQQLYDIELHVGTYDEGLPGGQCSETDRISNEYCNSSVFRFTVRSINGVMR